MLDAPTPTAAVWSAHNSVLRVAFSQSLVEQSLDRTNWSVALNPSGTLVPVSAAVMAGSESNQVELVFAVSADGALSVSYAAAPADVVGIGGAAAQPFVFPAPA